MASPGTVTATFDDPTGTAIQGNSFARFRLRNISGFVPRVQSTGVIVQTQIDVFPNSSGMISTPLWFNDQITPVNTLTLPAWNGTWWTIEFWQGGKLTSSGNYIFFIASSPYDLDVTDPLVFTPPPPVVVITPASGVTGTGVTGQVALWTSSTAIGSSLSINDLGAAGLFVILPTVTSPAVGGNVDILAGRTSATSSLGGNIDIRPGGCAVGGNTLANVGYITLSGVVYLNSQTAFNQLVAPNPNSGPGANGAVIFCRNANGPQDGATWGSIASGTSPANPGTGAILKYDGTNWRVIG